MSRCSWCNRILWPWQHKSIGRTMHTRCQAAVNEMIYRETQRQYRWAEEDRL